MPNRFVASATAHPRAAVVDDPAAIEDVRAVVKLRSGGAVHELLIATELGGGLRVVPADRARLPQRARAQLAFHEVASNRCLELVADELYVFDLQMLELLPDAPGPNDALYAYGALRGPYPAMLGAPLAAVDGQLTVTRADLLGGISSGLARAFAYSPDAHGSRCVHALLPGERAEVIAAGRGIVVAFPLAPAWTLERVVPNDLVVAQMLYDVLSALRVDLGQTGGDELPVPSRAALERALVEAGWRIEGDVAVRSRGLLRASERRSLPRQATLDDLVAEVARTLARMAGIPSPETAALHARLATTRTSITPAVAPPPRRITQPIGAVSAPRPRIETPRSEWMKDFVDAHRSPSSAPPRLSSPARAVAPEATPSWMQDFAEPAPPGGKKDLD